VDRRTTQRVDRSRNTLAQMGSSFRHRVAVGAGRNAHERHGAQRVECGGAVQSADHRASVVHLLRDHAVAEHEPERADGVAVDDRSTGLRIRFTHDPAP